MKFKLMSLLILISLFSTNSFANDSDIYQTTYGPVDLVLLGDAISSKINADVDVESVRWSYNPLIYILGTSGALGDTDSDYYVINLKVNQKHSVSCLLDLKMSHLYKEVRIRLDDCSSKTSSLVMSSFIWLNKVTPEAFRD